MAVLTQDRLSTLQAEFRKAITDIGFSGTPAFDRFKKMAPKIGTKLIWARRILTKMKDQLNGAVTAGATTWTIDGNTSSNKIKYWGGNMAALCETEWALITANPTATTITVERGAFGSTAATHADNTPIYIVPINPIGSPNLGKDDSQLASREYNFIQNYQKELPVANPLADGSMPNFVGENEASPEHQKKLWDYEARLQAERIFFEGNRYNQGGAAQTGASVTLTADGGNNMTGGIRYFNSQHSGRSTTYTIASRENLQSGVRYLYGIGAFAGIQKSKYGDANAVAYMNPITWDDYQQLQWVKEQVTNQKQTEFGGTTSIIMVSGTRVALEASDGVQPGNQFLVPAREDMYSILLKRWGEEQPKNHSGDQTVYTCTYTWMNEIRDGLTTEVASGFPTS